jgi:hypothetical protein
VLVVVESEASLPAATAAIRATVKDLREPELKLCHFELQGASNFNATPR